MKKMFTIFSLCIVVYTSTIAQPEIIKDQSDCFLQYPKSEIYKAKQDILSLLSKQKSEEWWEPSILNMYRGVDSKFRFVFYYDSNFNSTTDLFQEWSNGDWVNYAKYSYTHDANNNLLTDLCQTWLNGNWVNYSIYTYTYDNNNNMLTGLRQEWFNDNWVNYTKNSFTYDNNNNKLTFLTQYFDNNNWVDAEKSIFTYDTNNNCLTVIYQIFEDNNLVNYNKVISTYDVNNNLLIEGLIQKWSNGDWENFDKSIYTYNANNILVSKLNLIWSNDDWDNNRQNTYTYDENNNMLVELRQGWENGDLVHQDRVTYTYDINNNMLVNLSQRWENDDWVNSIKKSYMFDDNNNSISGEAQRWINNTWTNYDDYLSIFYNDISIYTFYGYYKYEVSYKSNNTLEIKDSQTENIIKLFPNPVSDIVYIENQDYKNSEVKLYSVQGNLLITTTDNYIDVSSLAGGVYIMNINGQTYKIIKQ